jgi:hypothetical protein
MFFRKPEYRRFEYSPRFYRPQEDRVELLKAQMRLQRDRSRRKRKSPLIWALLIVLLFYAYLYLSGSLH